MSLKVAEATGSRGVITVANDDYLDWLLALLGSLRATNPGLPVAVIPYDDHAGRVVAALNRLGMPLWCPAGLMRTCGKIAEAVGSSPAMAGTFRRLAAFEGPFEAFLYLDADTVALTTLAGVFRAAADSGRQIVFADRSPGMVYVPGARRDALVRAGSAEWGTGVFVGRNDIVRVSSFLAVARRMSSADVGMLRPTLIDQGFLNWCVDKLPLSAASLQDVSCYDGTWAYGDARGGAIAWLLHWAGLARPYPGMPHGELWRGFHAAGAAAAFPRGSGREITGVRQWQG
jgi:hypothetical protein